MYSILGLNVKYICVKQLNFKFWKILHILIYLKDSSIKQGKEQYESFENFKIQVLEVFFLKNFRTKTSFEHLIALQCHHTFSFFLFLLYTKNNSLLFIVYMFYRSTVIFKKMYQKL